MIDKDKLAFSWLNDNHLLDLLELNTQLVESWHHYDKERTKGEASVWEELTPFERFIHGGPWNDPECLNIHLSSILDFGKVLGVWYQDELIGEMEFHETINPHHNLQCPFIHIDWMMVSPKFRRMGIGKNMIDYLEKTGGVNHIDTEPEDGSEDFYLALDFDERLPRAYTYQFAGSPSPATLELEWNDLKIYPTGKEFVYGDAQNPPSYTIHNLKVQPRYAKLFGDEIRAGVATMEFEGRELRVIDHRFAVAPGISHPLFYDQQALDPSMMHRALHKTIQGNLVEKAEKSTFTTEGKSDYLESEGWEKMYTVVRMQKKINS